MDRGNGRRWRDGTADVPSALRPVDSVAAKAGGRATPSHSAAERLARTLHERTAEYRTDATIDLTMVEALLKVEGPAAAYEALDDHASSLGALVADLHAALAEATVERDAEAILETARSGAEPPAGLVARLRATALGVTGAITLLAVLVITPFRIIQPRLNARRR